MDPYDSGETAISYDYDADEVVVYTTRNDVYEGLLARTVRPTRHRPLLPGYELIYRLADWPDPSDLLL
jgi:hypothetical protein